MSWAGPNALQLQRLRGNYEQKEAEKLLQDLLKRSEDKYKFSAGMRTGMKSSGTGGLVLDSAREFQKRHELPAAQEDGQQRLGKLAGQHQPFSYDQCGGEVCLEQDFERFEAEEDHDLEACGRLQRGYRAA